MNKSFSHWVVRGSVCDDLRSTGEQGDNEEIDKSDNSTKQGARVDGGKSASHPPAGTTAGATAGESVTVLLLEELVDHVQQGDKLIIHPPW